MSDPLGIRLLAVFDPLVDGRAFADVAPPGVAFPRITFQQVGGRSTIVLEGGPAIIRRPRIQVDIWAETRDEADALMLAVDDRLRSAPFFAEPQGEASSGYDEIAKVARARQDFMIAVTR